MHTYQIKKATTDVSIELRIIDSTDGTPETGVVFNTSGIDLEYRRDGAVSVDITEADLTTPALTDAHEDGGFLHIGNGVYRLDLPDAACATGVDKVIVHGTVTGMVVIGCAIQLVDYDPFDAVRLGLTSLPNAAADAAGGLPISDAGGLDMDDIVQLNATAQANLEDQYDTTGLSGDTFPSTQSQLSGIANVGSAVHRPASSYTLTTGTQSANTVASTEALDETRHEHTDDAGVMSLEYHFLIGSGTASSIQVTGYVTGNNDDIDVYGYDWVTAGYKQIGNLQGSASTTNQVNSFDLFVDMVGSGGDLGKVDIKLEKASGLSSALLAIDQIFVAFSQGESGYVDGIEVDTNASNTNTVPGIDGVKGNPVSTWAAALTLSASTGIEEFKIINGSAITLSANSDNYTIVGQSYTLALNSQSIASIYVFGGDTTGTGTGSGAVFEDCPIGNVTLPPSVMRRCFPYGTITNSGTGDWFINDPRSRVAGSGTPVFDFGTAVGNTNLNIRANSGGWQLEAMGDTGTDVASIEGWGQVIEGTCTGGTVTIRGNFTTSGITNLTLSDDARFDSVQLIDDNWDEVISKAAHDVGQSAAKILRQSGDLVQIDGAVSDVSPAVGGFDTNLIQPDGYFDDAVMIFSNGAANAGIGLPVSSYLNANGAVTFDSPDQWPVTPVNGDDFVIFATHVHPVAQIAGAVWTTADRTLTDGIQKNAVFPNLEFLMVDSTDHVSPKTGLTVTGQRSIDGAAFANVTGAIAEVSNGIYQFDAAAADTNGDVITYRFSSAGADDRFLTITTQ